MSSARRKAPVGNGFRDRRRQDVAAGAYRDVFTAFAKTVPDRSLPGSQNADLEVTVQFATRKPWVPVRGRIALWVLSALGNKRGDWDLSVRIVGAAESRRLNREYRGKDKPTNVLSFPATVARADGRRPLGDLVVCAPVIAREARAQAKTLAAHWAHLIVHGTLHLLGYDHRRAADAQRMERREVTVLRSLGYSNPYS